MAVGDIVKMDGGDQLPGAPRMGVVQEEDNVSSPATATILWRGTGQLSVVPQLQLSKIVAAPNAVRQVGLWAQIVGYPQLEFEVGFPTEGAPPKTPAAAGPIVDAFATVNYGQAGPGAEKVIIALEDGRSFLEADYALPGDTEGAYYIQPGRRNV